MSLGGYESICRRLLLNFVFLIYSNVGRASGRPSADVAAAAWSPTQTSQHTIKELKQKVNVTMWFLLCYSSSPGSLSTLGRSRRESINGGIFFFFFFSVSINVGTRRRRRRRLAASLLTFQNVQNVSQLQASGSGSGSGSDRALWKHGSRGQVGVAEAGRGFKVQ